MVAHDVSRELRGYHGRWTKGGAALKRMAREAEQRRAVGGGESGTRRGKSIEDMHATIDEIAHSPHGTGRGVNGIMVRNTPAGIRVTMPGKTQHYSNSAEAAVAVFRKEHHQEGHSPIPLPGGAHPKAGVQKQDIKGMSAEAIQRQLDAGHITRQQAMDEILRQSAARKPEITKATEITKVGAPDIAAGLRRTADSIDARQKDVSYQRITQAATHLRAAAKAYESGDHQTALDRIRKAGSVRGISAEQARQIDQHHQNITDLQRTARNARNK